MPKAEYLTQASRPHSINDTRLFAALVTLGIQPAEGPQIYIGETLDGTPKQTWYLERQSICGRFKTAEMIAAWNDARWHDANPEHPLAYIRCAFQNMVSCIDHIKQSMPMQVIRGRGGKLGLIGPHDTKKATEHILKTLKR